MKKIETLVAKFDSKVQIESKKAQETFRGSIVKLKLLKEKLDYIENKKIGAVKSTNQILEFLKARGMSDTKVKGRSYTHKQVVIESFGVQLCALELLLESSVHDLVQA